MNTSLFEISEFIDGSLDIKNVADWPNALNGLQLSNRGAVTRIGAAVDAGEPTLRAAAEMGVDLLLVHHGLFWAGLQPLTGAVFPENIARDPGEHGGLQRPPAARRASHAGQ